MASTHDLDGAEAFDPIDIVESIAARHDWEFDRIADDQITMSVEGQWRTYALTLAWSSADEMLRLISTFEMEPPEDRLPQLYELLNLTNDQCWAGAFTYWADQRLMVWRYGLALDGGQVADPEQIARMISAAVSAAERFYPAFQLATWGRRTVDSSMKIAICEAYGRA
ncbi:YbjN domain-containing protein [Profundibacterium mesophilum]|uniref:Diacylglyceryl transferase n=1 Tax=Profundibacterium mesophilum KAUST100406-0324 TaxID=1037889 RepID=A0A921TDS1_9RHOB|nr:YbjN domain-containing protein [Profundibacterium mesophilum]KAF0676621.1 hypothetical protein PMES_01353 [Profundibacterium mesophilum KAUST100406-0324]